MFHTRRDLLKISAGGAFALVPFLESVRAHADGNERVLPKRFVFVVKSSGIDRENLLPSGMTADLENTARRQGLVRVPLAQRRLPEIFQPFESLKSHLTIIQGLSGKNFNGNHTAGYGVLSCHNSERAPIAPTLDYMLGQRFSSGPYPMYAMAMNGTLLGQRTPPGNGFCYPNISAIGSGKAVAFQASPSKAYMELFGAAVRTPDQARRRLTVRTNLMDFLRDDARRIQRQLSSQERERFENYTNAFESIRVQDRRRAALRNQIIRNAPEYGNKYTSNVETVRQEAQFELATAALITGLTNVVTLRPDTLGTTYTGLGIMQTGLHAIGHGGTTDNGWTSVRARKEIDKYHLGLIAEMANKLKSVREGNGTMLDNTLIVYTSCAGGSHHGGQGDWPFILVGGLGGRLRMGQYVQYPTYQQQGHKTIANLYLSILDAVGLRQGNSFGQVDPMLRDLDIAGPLSELAVS
ncbi:MAG: DUF1552 domain-containing protein [Gemmataceae bacterium]